MKQTYRKLSGAVRYMDHYILNPTSCSNQLYVLTKI